ncbi:hypothetical protein V2J09_013545 [Rumex salicifolius]
MVVNVIKWRPWLPIQSRKYEAAITVRCLKGLGEIGGNQSDSPPSDGGLSRLTVEIRWKGSKGNGFRALSRRVKRNCTREVGLSQNGVAYWDEEFTSSCSFSGNPYELAFFVFNGSDRRSKNKVMVAGPAILNLAELASTNDKQELETSVPLTHSGDVQCNPSLCLTLRLTELAPNQEPVKSIQRSLTTPLTAPLSPCFGVPQNVEEEELSPPRKSLKKMKSLTEYISSRGKPEKPCTEFSTGSEDSEYNESFDTDSFDYSDGLFSEENRDDSDNVPRNSFGYGSLVSANFAGGGFDVKRSEDDDDDDFVYYRKHKTEIGSLYADDLPPLSPEVAGQSLKLSPKLGILTWKKRKLSFRSPKVKVKGEPLLKKEYGERGGDDIDFDRYQLSSSDELSSRRCNAGVPISEFGDDNFAVGSWECKEIVSRDGSMKLQTQVFFASIDQRNEKAAGESACTALVAVITDWLHSNKGEMPIKSELDSLIREGSLQWRNLCEVESYMSRFPDKHFDLDTVLEAKIKPISVVPEKSFIGFFHPEGVEEEEGLGFLDGAMSFDNIWDEISHVKDDAEALIYVVSWNDHFFVLKVESDAYYVIDTLGERLYEGCKQAYVLKFDKEATIKRVSSKEENGEKSSDDRLMNGNEKEEEEEEEEEEEDTIDVCKGKEACKEYIKSFLAAIPIRELQADIKKGRVSSAPLHHRLQIEFHHTVALVQEEAKAETEAY